MLPLPSPVETSSQPQQTIIRDGIARIKSIGVLDIKTGPLQGCSTRGLGIFFLTVPFSFYE